MLIYFIFPCVMPKPKFFKCLILSLVLTIDGYYVKLKVEVINCERIKKNKKIFRHVI